MSVLTGWLEGVGLTEDGSVASIRPVDEADFPPVAVVVKKSSANADPDVVISVSNTRVGKDDRRVNLLLPIVVAVVSSVGDALKECDKIDDGESDVSAAAIKLR